LNRQEAEGKKAGWTAKTPRAPRRRREGGAAIYYLSGSLAPLFRLRYSPKTINSSLKKYLHRQPQLLSKIILLVLSINEPAVVQYRKDGVIMSDLELFTPTAEVICAAPSRLALQYWHPVNVGTSGEKLAGFQKRS
jgi:hypothetical protein